MAAKEAAEADEILERQKVEAERAKALLEQSEANDESKEDRAEASRRAKVDGDRLGLFVLPREGIENKDIVRLYPFAF